MSDIVQKLVGALERLSGQCERMRLPGQSMSDAERNAIAALSEAKAGGWQPIETAPKDGRMILVSFGAKGVRAVSWDTPFDDVADDDTGLWCVDDDKHGPYPLRGYSYNSPTAPTAWQPLPAPPAQKEPT